MTRHLSSSNRAYSIMWLTVIAIINIGGCDEPTAPPPPAPGIIIVPTLDMGPVVDASIALAQLDDRCRLADGGRRPCEADLICVLDRSVRSRGFCKQPCRGDGDCRGDATCNTDFTDAGFCELGVREGQACDPDILAGQRRCISPSGRRVVCLDDTCRGICQDFAAGEIYPCPDGEGCGEPRAGQPGFDDAIAVCEPGGRCGEVFSPDACLDCVEAQCCEATRACADDPDCQLCAARPSRVGCDTNAAYAQVRACGEVGAPCGPECTPDACADLGQAGSDACDRCVADRCCAVLQPCADDEDCRACLADPSRQGCVLLGTYRAVLDCSRAACDDACTANECGQPGDFCDTDAGCCRGACDDGLCEPCQTRCAGRECGSDGCGGVCGDCQAGEGCLDGTCCTANCDGRVCGSNGCGGSCGLCADGEACNGGQCECEPQCDGRTCGLDARCGVPCGACEDGEECRAGRCCPGCGDRVCGEEPVCGESCGRCGRGLVCDGGACGECSEVNFACEGAAQCCAVDGAGVDCRLGFCEICAPAGFICGAFPCCGDLFCNPASICNDRACSELGQDCLLPNDCCDNTVCDRDADSTCQRCREANVRCSTGRQCCSGNCENGGCR